MPQVPNYAGMYAGLGQSIASGLQAIPENIEKDKAVNAWKEKLKNFKQLKIDFTEELVQKMSEMGENYKSIENTKKKVMLIDDPSEFEAKATAYVQQIDDWKINEESYKFRPVFGQKYETFAKMNTPYKQQAEQKRRGEVVPKAIQGAPAEVGVREGEPPPESMYQNPSLMGRSQSPAGTPDPGGAGSIPGADLSTGLSGRAYEQVPEIAPAKDKGEAFRRAQEQIPELTTGQFEEAGGEYLPSMEQLAKSDNNQDRQKYLEAKEKRLSLQQKFRESQDSWKKQIAWAKYYLDKDVKIPKAQAKDLAALQLKTGGMIEVQENELTDLKTSLADAKNPKPQYEGGQPPEVNKALVDIIAEAIGQKKESIANNKVFYKRLMQIPGETRTEGKDGEEPTVKYTNPNAVINPKTVALPPPAVKLAGRRNVSSIPGKSATTGRTSRDEAALIWAKEHPEHPLAQRVLKANGL